MKVILASTSPRRKKLLKKLLPAFSVAHPYINERIFKGEDFAEAAKRLALKKAEKIAKFHKDAIIIGADTIAYLGRRILGKTKSEKAARKVLRILSGKTHEVITGVALLHPSGKKTTYFEKAKVKMKNLDDKTIERYLKSEEWKDRAGCYDISGKGAKLIEKVLGEKETVAGLPLKKLPKLICIKK